jgi:hypothetical protein
MPVEKLAVDYVRMTKGAENVASILEYSLEKADPLG